ncbi:MAG: phosphoenolpyruvate synthase [Pseudonocardiaceae bacterium]|nr:phosphoenolpyruvate synthase [Pseudonocardiaceae bacterium]
MGHVIRFEDYTTTDRAVLGGKNASLGELVAAGLPVPPGFAVSADAYKEVLGTAGLVGPLAEAVAAADPDAGGRARAMVSSAPLPGELVDAVRAAYAQLCRRCGRDDLPVAVRTSATCEDQPDASFAGEHETYLWVRGADAVLEHMRRCWASLFTDRAICYRAKMGYDEATAAMSVGVQQMVVPRTSGVAFTLNPHDGDRSQVAIDASWGFGEAVVGGEVTPDNFLVDKVLGEVSKRTVSSKEIEYRLTGSDRVERADVGDDRRTTPSLTDEEIKAVAALARRAERHYGCPQDVEWAIDAHLAAPDNVLLLQSRPETVWSRRPRASVSSGTAGGYMSIVNTLVSPLHTRRTASTDG